MAEQRGEFVRLCSVQRTPPGLPQLAVDTARHGPACTPLQCRPQFIRHRGWSNYLSTGRSHSHSGSSGSGGSSWGRKGMRTRPGLTEPGIGRLSHERPACLHECAYVRECPRGRGGLVRGSLQHGGEPWCSRRRRNSMKGDVMPCMRSRELRRSLLYVRVGGDGELCRQKWRPKNDDIWANENACTSSRALRMYLLYQESILLSLPAANVVIAFHLVNVGCYNTICLTVKLHFGLHFQCQKTVFTI